LHQVIKLLLVHDIGEIDTIVYATPMPTGQHSKPKSLLLLKRRVGLVMKTPCKQIFSLALILPIVVL